MQLSETLKSPRTPHLLRIWADLIQLKEMPQLDRWLVLRMKQDKRFGSKDRRWYSEAVFSAVRWAMPMMEQKHGRGMQDPDQLWAEIRKLKPDEFFQSLSAFGDESSAEGLAGAGLSSWFQSSFERRAELSDWTHAERDAFLQSQNRRASLWLRANKPANHARIEAKLKELAVDYAWQGEALRIDGDKNLQQTPILEEGWAEVQDLGSQLLGLKIQLANNATLWDACAGGGGKSLQLAARFPQAKIFASDIRSYKSIEVSKRAIRAKLGNVNTLPWNGSTNLDLPRVASRGFDCIVVDAPCSGSGTWRRSPDGRFRVSKAAISELQSLQVSIVEKVERFLKPGGELIYATCSWLPEENEDVTAAIQAKLPLKLIEQSICGLPYEDADCLFYARFQKT